MIVRSLHTEKFTGTHVPGVLADMPEFSITTFPDSLMGTPASGEKEEEKHLFNGSGAFLFVTRN